MIRHPSAPGPPNRIFGPALFSSQGVAAQLDAVRVVDEAIQHGIGDRRLAVAPSCHIFFRRSMRSSVQDI